MNNIYYITFGKDIHRTSNCIEFAKEGKSKKDIINWLSNIIKSPLKRKKKRHLFCKN